LAHATAENKLSNRDLHSTIAALSAAVLFLREMDIECVVVNHKCECLFPDVRDDLPVNQVDHSITGIGQSGIVCHDQDGTTERFVELSE